MEQNFRHTITRWWFALVVLLVGIGVLVAVRFFHKPFQLTLVNTIPVEQEPLGLTLSPDFSRLYVANAQSGTISIIDTNSHTVTHTISVNPGGRLNSVVIAPDGTALYATDAKSGNVDVFGLPEGEKIATIPVRLFPQRMALSKKNAHLYVVNSASNNVSVIDTATHDLLTNIPVNERPYGIVIAPDHTRAYVTSSQTRSITIIDLESQKTSGTIVLETMSRLTNLIMSPDGNYLYICDAMSNSIVVVDIAAGKLHRTLNTADFDDSDLEFSPTDLALSQDGKLLYVVGRTGYISVINIETERVLATLEIGQDLRNIVLASDGRAYISSFGTNRVSVVH